MSNKYHESDLKNLERLGLLKPIGSNSTRDTHVGESNYSSKTVQPWSIWIDYNLNSFDADIIKRVLRTKQSDSRTMDYEKIIHICNERIRQLTYEEPTHGLTTITNTTSNQNSSIENYTQSSQERSNPPIG